VITDVDIVPNCSGQFNIVVGINSVNMFWSVSGPSTSHFGYLTSN
jgi:hypothetical protein